MIWNVQCLYKFSTDSSKLLAHAVMELTCLVSAVSSRGQNRNVRFDLRNDD